MIYGNVIHRSVALKALLVNQQGETRSENRLTGRETLPYVTVLMSSLQQTAVAVNTRKKICLC